VWHAASVRARHIHRFIDTTRPATDVAVGDRADISGANRKGPF
jgi:hypothetical protein